MGECLKIKHKVWFNKTTAILWVLAGLAAFRFGWQDAVWFVVVASVYANVKADWSTAEAADTRDLMARFKHIEQNQERIEEKLDRILQEKESDNG